MAQIEHRAKQSVLSTKRNRWTSVLSWGTFVLAFASFSAIWYNVQGEDNAAQVPSTITITDNQSDANNSNPSNSNPNQNNQSSPYSYNPNFDPFAGAGGQVSPGRSRSSGGGFRSRAS